MTGVPTAPAGLVAIVNGGTVRLSWNRSVGAQGYRLEAGTAAGLADLVNADMGDQTAFQGLVPPGTYFVRVRAVNAAGVSGAVERGDGGRDDHGVVRDAAAHAHRLHRADRRTAGRAGVAALGGRDLLRARCGPRLRRGRGERAARMPRPATRHWHQPAPTSRACGR